MIRLSHGNHFGKEGGCLVELASLVLAKQIMENGQVRPQWMSNDKHDTLPCLSSAVCQAVRRVNDTMPEDELWRLAPLLPRLLRARRCEGTTERRVSLRMAIWAARSVLHHVDPRLLERCERAISNAEASLWGEQGPADDREWAPGFNTAAHAALLLGDQSQSLEVIWGAVASLDEDELVIWLSDCLDAWEKAVVEEGVTFDWDESYPADEEIDLVVNAILASRPLSSNVI